MILIIIIIIVIIKTGQNNVSGGRDECNEIRNFPGLFNLVASTPKKDEGCSFQTDTKSISKQGSVCGVFICAWSICKCLCWTGNPCSPLLHLLWRIMLRKWLFLHILILQGLVPLKENAEKNAYSAGDCFSCSSSVFKRPFVLLYLLLN